MKFRLTLLSALVAGLPTLATAQSGTVRYDQSTRLDFKLPPNSPFADRLPKSAVKAMQLTFSPKATLYAEAPQGDDAQGGARAGEVRFSGGGGGGHDVIVTRSMEGGSAVMAMGGFGMGGSGAQDAIAGAFTNLDDGSYVEVREFLGRTFRIPTDRPTFAWKLTGEQAMYMGHHVLQAKAHPDSTSLEAWFTPDIPVSAGPAQYGGLPGLILTLTVDSNRITYTATAIDTTTPIPTIKAPSDGSKVTRAEFDRIVKEKTAEIEKSRRGRGGK